MATVTMDPDVRSWTPINMWAMIKSLINNNTPILTINGILFPITNGVNGSFVGQAGKGALLIDFANGLLYQNTGTISSPTWTTILGGAAGGGGVPPASAPLTIISANGTIPSNVSADYIITKNGALMETLAAPIPGGPGIGNDGVEVLISSSTPFQHVILATGLLQTGTAAQNSIVFPQFAGGEVDLVAFNGKWMVLNSQQVVFQ